MAHLGENRRMSHAPEAAKTEGQRFDSDPASIYSRTIFKTP